MQSTVPIYSAQKSSFGVPSASSNNTDLISPALRNQIISGKDINLNMLLIPNYETPYSKKSQDNDERLTSTLSPEMYHCLWEILPSKFYEYHRIFSAKCTAQH